MKKIIITIAIALLSSLTAMSETQRVAVFDPAGNAPSHVNEIVREIFSSVIVNTDGYIVLERSLIDHVLAENRFQGTGLVDDAQISELGRLMGANLAFVTSLTRMSDGNFFVSARVIDVVTARIERQQTARTSRAGEAELINTAEQLARDMFAQIAQPRARAQQGRQVSETQPVAFTADMLTADRRRVSQRGMQLTQTEVRQVMSRANNFDALQLYDRGMQRNRNANIVMYSGLGTIGAGGVTMLLAHPGIFGWRAGEYRWGSYVPFDRWNWGVMEVGMVIAGAGVTSIIIGAFMKPRSNRQVGDAVNMHNRNLNRAENTVELNFGVTNNGVGLVLNF